jgi:hypothetical protein
VLRRQDEAKLWEEDYEKQILQTSRSCKQKADEAIAIAKRASEAKKSSRLTSSSSSYVGLLGDVHCQKANRSKLGLSLKLPEIHA